MASSARLAPREIKFVITPEFYDQLVSKSVALGLSFDQSTLMLLRLGLAEQNRKEEEIKSLVESMHAQTGPDRSQTFDRLGEAVFGK